MARAKFSVLMSVYGKESPVYLKVSLNSLIEQTRIPNEIILVEDGPLPASLLQEIEQFKKNHPDVLLSVKLPKNKGLGIALNEGLKYCNNDIVARMDADDKSVSDRFEIQIGYMESNPDVGMISSHITEYDEEMTKILAKREVPETHDAIMNSIRRRSPFNHMAAVYRKSIILKNGSYEDCPSFEDYYLWCKLASSGTTFYNIPQSLIEARTGDSMIRRRGGIGYARRMYDFQKRILKLGVISRMEFVQNVILRSLVALMPGSVRVAIYQKGLRGKV